MSQLKALPKDGKPIKNFQDKEIAWQQVYEGLKEVIEQLRKTFTIKDGFRQEMEKTDFLSQQHIRLQSIFVFPKLVSSPTRNDEEDTENIVKDESELLKNNYTLIHGERLSGKTALCRHLFLTIVDQSIPVLYLDLDTIDRKKASLDIFHDAYRHQFYGDYSLWEKQEGKVIILDNLSHRAIDHVILAIKYFDKVIVTLSTDTFYAYYRDDDRLARFKEIEIRPLTHSKQENLIRKRIGLSGQDKPVVDGQIDEIENRVNTIIINNKILPRYPFYVLSILQTYEAFMPKNLSVTSYGHCYHNLIIAHFYKSGIEKSDDETNACINFAENLAFEIYDKGSEEHSINRDLIDEFKKEYEKKFIPLKNSTLNRLFDTDYGILTGTDRFLFRSPYMYYFFLGKYLAKNSKKHEEVIERIIDRSYITSNFLILIFAIHHTNDDDIIEDVLIRTMCALDNIKPSSLEQKETNIFEDIVKAIPSSIMSINSVQSERERERNNRDNRELNDSHQLENTNDEDLPEEVNDIYRIMKNNEILGQILKNKYGSLERKKIVDIIENIADGGLRIVQFFLQGQKEINDFAIFIHEKNPEFDIEEVRLMIKTLYFIWTMHNVEKIVSALNKPEIRSLVEDVVAEKNTPAYELIEYFLRLDTIEEFSNRDREELKALWNKHRYPFFQKVISIRTQFYLNTHRVHTPIEQAVCSFLNIKYQPRLKKLD